MLVLTKSFDSEVKPDNLPADDYIAKLEDKVNKLEEQNKKIQERLSDMPGQIITNKYSNYEYIDGQIEDIKTERAESLKNSRQQWEYWKNKLLVKILDFVNYVRNLDIFDKEQKNSSAFFVNVFLFTISS